MTAIAADTITYLYPDNLRHDKYHTLDGMLVLQCLFCEKFLTPIEFDMCNHLREEHRNDLLTRLSLYGKGHNMDYRVQFAIDVMKGMEPKIFYDHKTATFAPPSIPTAKPSKYRPRDREYNRSE